MIKLSFIFKTRRILRGLIGTLFLLMSAAIIGAEPAGKFSVSLTPAYVVPEGEGAERGTVSPDGKHLTVWISVGERGYVWSDGHRSRLWDAILLPKYSSDSRHVAYIALEETGAAGNYQSYVVLDTTVLGPFNYLAFDKFGTDELVFSPDSRHFAFRAWEGGRAYAFLDGRKEGPYTSIIGPPPTFSPDSKRLAYLVADSIGARVVLDGQPGPRYDQVLDLAGFSDDSRSFSYLGMTRDSLWMIIKDSYTYGPFRQVSIAAYRPETQKLWFVASRDTAASESLYVDGRARVGHNRILEFAFSGDGRRTGFIAHDKDRWVVSIDSTRIIKSHPADRLAFSSNGRHYTYRTILVKDSATSFDSVFIDRKAFGPFVQTSPVVFSPDGARYLFLAIDSLRAYRIFADSAVYGPFDSAAIVGWSADSRHAAFTATEKGDARMYMDGHAHQPYRHVMRQVWYDTARGDAAYVADPEAKGICLVVNDSSLAMMDFYYGSARSFTEEGILRGYGQRGDTILQYIVRRTR